MPKLGVNIDHVATLRQARRVGVPDPVEAALVAQRGGCQSVVCHLREDRRHIQDADLHRLKRSLAIPLNLEMAAHPEIVQIACRVRPHQATLVPERRRELTTEGGLDLRKDPRRLADAVRRLKGVGMRVSLFIDPDPVQIRLAHLLGVPMIELHTGRYAGSRTPEKRGRALQQIKEAARMADALGLMVAAGHGLDYSNARAVAAIPQMEELNIGFSIIVRAIEVGFFKAVKEMLALVKNPSRHCESRRAGRSNLVLEDAP